MARTVQTIYDLLVDEKELFTSLDSLVPNPDTAQTFLADFNSTSKVANWRSLFWVVAHSMNAHEVLWELFRDEIDAKILANQFAQLPWYSTESKKFQNGFELTYNSNLGRYTYADTTSVEAENSKIVTQAAAQVINGQVVIKIAKSDGSSGLDPLSTTELSSFTNYIDNIKPAGTNSAIVNQDGDKLRFTCRIEYDPKIIDSTGLLIKDSTITTLKAGDNPASTAAKNYIKAIPFDNVFRVNDLIDALEGAEGFTNPTLTVCDYDPSPFSGAWTSILSLAGQKYNPVAGYLEESTFSFTYVSL
jgi:hypothetical protein